MAHKSRNYPHSTNFEMSDVQRQRLEDLAELEDVKMAVIVRKAIDARYRHQILGERRCADCADCRCPQFFVAPPSALPPGPTQDPPASLPHPVGDAGTTA